MCICMCVGERLVFGSVYQYVYVCMCVCVHVCMYVCVLMGMVCLEGECVVMYMYLWSG